MTLLRRKRVLAAKVETTPGTAESLTASEGAFNAYNVIAQANITIEEREGQGAFNYLAGVPGARGGTLSFSVDLGWDGSATIPTWASVLLPGCGLVNSSGTLSPLTEVPGSNVKTLTLATYVDGVKKTLAGAMGNVQFVFPSGRMARADFTFTGVWQTVTDTSLIAPTYPTAAALRFASAVVTYDSVAQKVEQVTVDLGNSVILREDATTATGYSTALVTNRNPRITANPEAQLVATDDRYGDWVAGTTAALVVTLDGPSDATLSFQADKAQYMNVQEGNRNDMVIDDVEWACTSTGTNDDELVMVFTEAT